MVSFHGFGASPIHIESIGFDIREVFRNTIKLFQNRIHTSQIQIECVVDDSIPEHVIGDPLRYRQVLAGFLSNAVKYSRAGTVIHVDLKLKKHEAEHCTIVTIVKDQGYGMDPILVRQLVEFGKLSASDLNFLRENRESKDLSVPVMHHLIRAMHGELNIQSQADYGSCCTFSIDLKAKLDKLDSESFVPAIRKVSAYSNDFSGKHILVVEDNEFNQLVIKNVLQRMKLKITIAENGALGVQAVLSDPTIDLVLMDLHMPVMNGLDATKKIRSLSGQAGKIPIVALTACNSQEDEDNCKRVGMNAFLSKPIDVMKIAQTLSGFLSPQAETT